MLVEHPLSQDAQRGRDLRPILGPEPKTADLRALMKTLPMRAAHSFQYKGEWKSLTIEAMATFYEDVVLHQVGQMRLSAWWEAQHQRRSVGAALTMWFDLNSTGTLPDAIEIGLLSTKVGRFEKVFCLCFKD